MLPEESELLADGVGEESGKAMEFAVDCDFDGKGVVEP